MRGVALQVIVCKEAIAEVNAADVELKQVCSDAWKCVNSESKVTDCVLCSVQAICAPTSRQGVFAFVR